MSYTEAICHCQQRAAKRARMGLDALVYVVADGEEFDTASESEMDNFHLGATPLFYWDGHANEGGSN